MRPISKPIRRGGFIAGFDGGKSWVSFKYEWLPLFCHYCGILGHDLKHCAAHYAVEKAGGRIEYQYGDFLRAVRGRPRAQGSKAAGPTFVSEEGKGSEAEKRAVQAAQGGPVETMEAHDFSHENPSITDRVNAMIQGNRAELAHVDSSQSNTHAHVTDTNFALKETGPKIQQVNQLVSDFTEAKDTGETKIKTGGVHVKSISLEDQISEFGTLFSNPDQTGPMHLKPKNTWTRMNRMDFGLSGLTKSITLPGLGKSDGRERQEMQIEKQTVKKGRLSAKEKTKDDVSTGVKSHPCREQ